jgi:hypothetical protein
MKKIHVLFFLLIIGAQVYGKEYHVSVKGDDANGGTEAAPFKTIQKAAQAAYPGDVITVHAGTYREWINPPRGGTSDDCRIVYRAASGERVDIKGSEQIASWQKVERGIWKATLPHTFFGDYNPYTDSIDGDWFYNHGRVHHTGEVFLNNRSLYEKETLDKVLHPIENPDAQDKEGAIYTWYCESDKGQVTIWANFHHHNPNKELVEISVRKTCFYPEKPGINYLTIQGFHISQAATQWAAPTAEQIGMVATHWNKGWVIEDNVISHSKCSGITLGKERGTGHNVWSNDRSIDGSLHYIEVTFRTLRNGWNKENIGSHVVRNNEIFACEQTGICGSMGAAFSVVKDNHIHHIWTKRQFSGAEIAGIKFHAAIDVQIEHNHIHNVGRGMWMDWMAQGTRISRNLLYNNDSEDLFFEVDHGPYLVDNNILLSPSNVWDMSQGGAFVHNLFAGNIRVSKEPNRYTPYHLPHQTDVAGLSIIVNGDNRFFNNLFAPISPDGKNTYGTAIYNNAGYPCFASGNVYCNNAAPFEKEAHGMVVPDNLNIKIEDDGREVYLSFTWKELTGLQTEIVSTERLGKAKLPKQRYEQPDGNSIVFDTDYQGATRDAKPAPGALERLQEGENRVKVWSY